MKALFLILSAMILSCNLHAQAKNEEIEKVIKQQQADWNKNDMPSFANAFTDDATLINFLGFVWKGKEEIVKQFSFINECCIRPTSVEFELGEVKYLDDSYAIAYVKEKLTAKEDYQVPGGTVKKGSIDHKIVTAVMVKKDGSWKITSMQVTQVSQAMNR